MENPERRHDQSEIVTEDEQHIATRYYDGARVTKLSTKNKENGIEIITHYGKDGTIAEIERFAPDGTRFAYDNLAAMRAAIVDNEVRVDRKHLVSDIALIELSEALLKHADYHEKSH